MKCIVQDCDRETVARNMCDKHYQRYKKYGDPTVVKHKYDNYIPQGNCTVAECSLKAEVRGMCHKHYNRWLNYGDPTIVKHKSHNYPPHEKCIVDGCDLKGDKARNMCRYHYNKWLRYGDPTFVREYPPHGICVVEGCDLEAIKRDMCSKHYEKWKRYGDPTVSKRSSPGEPLRFLHENILTHKDDECLPWPYGRNDMGYGIVHIDGVRNYVHTTVCEMVNGPRPSDDHVASHKCGNGHLGCCSPKHLKWQTKAEDSADRIAHGTAYRGSKHWKTVLTEEFVLEIRSLEDKLSVREIAKKFGVTQQTIDGILKRITWDWLK